MSDFNEKEPCLVKAGQGFSVKYKGRFLYSKYEPQKSIMQTVSSLSILPGTLVLCCSPCLGYGLDELAQALPENCLMIGCEADEKLYEIAESAVHSLKCAADGRYILLKPHELCRFPAIINMRDAQTENGSKLPHRGTFRRAIRIDFSAGVFTDSSFYMKFAEAAENAVAQFWKNRLTLIKFGRRYSRNLFRNLAYLPDSLPFSTAAHSVTKPVLVLGAGPGMEYTVQKIKSNITDYFILAVDAALPALTAENIKPDGAVCEEAQTHIAKAFIGSRNAAEYAFAGLSSCPRTAATAGRNVCWHAAIYDDTIFFERLNHLEILPPAVPPLGSVGLTAVYIALKLRHDSTVPVYVCGLDFSYTAGITHARGTAPAIERLSSSTRLKPAENYGAAFGEGTETITDKAGKTAVTTAALDGYAKIFYGIFTGTQNLFDSGISGLPLGIPFKEPESDSTDTEKTAAEQKSNGSGGISADGDYRSSMRKKIISFYSSEKKALEEIRDILSNGQKLSETERNERLKVLLQDREYLYLHFPDGEKLSLETQFLKRVRTEIDFFLKDIGISLKIASVC